MESDTGTEGDTIPSHATPWEERSGLLFSEEPLSHVTNRSSVDANMAKNRSIDDASEYETTR